jgi:hypothetical protein
MMTEVQRKIPPNLYILNLSFIYFATGMLMFLSAMAAAIWVVPEMVQLQSLRHPKGWMIAHALLLGWASMIAMGASFQLTQVIMRTSLFSRTMGFVQYAFYTVGLLALIFGFLGQMKWIAAGGTAVTVGVILYVVNLTVTHIRKREWNIYVLGVGLSQLSFLVTVLLGVLMGIGFAAGWSHDYSEIVFYSHMWFGVGGWLSGLILIYSLKLLPMFYVSKKKPTRSAYGIIGGFHAGIWLQAASLWSGIGWLGSVGLACLALSVGWFILYVFSVRKQSNGKQPVGAVKVAFWLIPVTYFFFLLWMLSKHEAFIIFLIMGWFTASIFSYLSKILPFLWWAYRFRTKEEKKGAILLSDMLPENRLQLVLTAYVLAVIGVVTGYLLQLPMVSLGSQAAACIFIVAYIIGLLRVFKH